MPILCHLTKTNTMGVISLKVIINNNLTTHNHNNNNNNSNNIIPQCNNRIMALEVATHNNSLLKVVIIGEVVAEVDCSNDN